MIIYTLQAPEVGVSEKQSTPLTSSVFENMASKAALMGRGKGREKMHRLKTQEEPKPLKANKDTTKAWSCLCIHVCTAHYVNLILFRFRRNCLLLQLQKLRANW